MNNLSTSRKFFLSFLTFIFFFLMVEFGLQFFYFSDRLFQTKDENLWSLEKDAEVVKEGILFRTNSLGLRNDEVHHEEDEFLILCLGDSSTFGWFVREEETYPRLLEKRLQEKTGKKIEVVNAGVPGYTTYQNLTFLRTSGMDFQPDLVILKAGHNERRLVYASERGFVERKGLVRALYKYLRHLNLFQFIMEQMRKNVSSDLPPDIPRVSAENMTDDIKVMLKILKRKKVPLIFLYWDTRIEAKELKREAEKALLKKEYEKSAGLLKQALSIEMNWDFELFEMLSVCFEKMGDNEAAADCRKKAGKWHLRFGTFMDDEDYLLRLRDLHEENERFHLFFQIERLSYGSETTGSKCCAYYGAYYLFRIYQGDKSIYSNARKGKDFQKSQNRKC